MDIRVLGPLEVIYADAPLVVSRRKQRSTLGILAVNAGRPVSLDQLIQEHWGAEPIPSSVANARGYVNTLRRMFDMQMSAATRLIPTEAGYVLHASAEELDLLRYEQYAREGRRALSTGDLDTARTRLAQARSLWRGAILDGLPRGQILQTQCAAIEHDVAALTDSLAEVHLATGQPATAESLALRQLEADPMRERSYELLMMARYQLAGAAAALAVYDAARRTLVDNLAVEPQAGLRALQQRVLDRDPTLEVQGAPVTIATPPRLPGQLPPGTAAFIGRGAEVAAARTALTPGDRRSRPRPPLVIIHGPAGAGKSELALYIAHGLMDSFPDGQIYLDLRGYVSGVAPLTRDEALGSALAMVGVRDEAHPATIEVAAAVFRSTIASQRVLVVIDNAVNVDQVVDLVPGSATCGVLVTSRSPLPMLDADHRLALAGLPNAQARALLSEYSGREFDDHDSDRIAELCECLPLALRIAAARLAALPRLSAAEYAVRLAQHPLDELAHGPLSVRASIRCGVRNLQDSGDPDGAYTARLFPALARIAGDGDVRVDEVAMLLEQDRARVQRAVDQLVETHLLTMTPNGRYRLPPLVRQVAIEIGRGGQPATPDDPAGS